MASVHQRTVCLYLIYAVPYGFASCIATKSSSGFRAVGWSTYEFYVYLYTDKTSASSWPGRPMTRRSAVDDGIAGESCMVVREARSASAHAGKVAFSRLSFGGAPMGNLYASVDDDTAIATITHAWQQGVRHFDTAPYYGYGLSERRLGTALSALDRRTYTLSTKVGRLIERRAGRNRSRRWLCRRRPCRPLRLQPRWRAALDRGKPERLCTDRVELLLLHDVGALRTDSNTTTSCGKPSTKHCRPWRNCAARACAMPSASASTKRPCAWK